MISDILNNVRKVHGPYFRRDGRKHVSIVYNDGKKRTVSYPKFLVEFALGRKLDPYLETIDHIDDDFTNNAWDNLRIVPKGKHSKEDVLTVDLVVIKCVLCGDLARKQAAYLDWNSRMGKAGPFCSNKCKGRYSRAVQLGRMKSLPVQPRYPVEKRIYRKGVKRGGVLVSSLVDNNITEKDILNFVIRYNATYKFRMSKRERAKVNIRVKFKKGKVCKVKLLPKCNNCGKSLKQFGRQYCSNACRGMADRKIERPSREKLQRLVWEYPTSKIAKYYGVSDNAIAKWCRNYDIKKPPRGYWAKKKAGKI